MQPTRAQFPGEGRIRTVIDRVEPAVDHGAFPCKHPAGSALRVTAWVFVDGHDSLVVRLLYRRRGESGWAEVTMEFLENDRWEGEFTPDEIGYWEYTVVAWTDAFQSWRKGFRKKVEDGQNPEVELQIAAGLVRETAQRMEGDLRDRLAGWADSIVSSSRPQTERVEFALGESLADVMLAEADRRFAATLPHPYPLLAERHRAVFSAWYEFFPRSRGTTPGEHGTFRSAARVLPEIAELGFDVVYLPPIHPIGETYRKGRNNALVAAPGDVGSPWAIGSPEGGHKSIHPALGTLKEFQDFLWRAGELGMEVALDIAFQCSPDHPYVHEHPDWFRWRPDGSIQYAENPPKKYQDIVPFDFECADWQGLWDELLSVFLYWIDKGVRIFRVDNPHTKPLPFWRWCIERIKELHPDVILLAEAFTRPHVKYWLGKAGFTHGYTYFTWRTGKEELMEYLGELTQTSRREHFWPNFWPNTPDILHEYLVHGGRPAHAVRFVLAATLSSNYGIYGPAFELCDHDPFPGKEEYNHNEKYQIKQWNWEKPGNLKPLLRRVNRIRRENRALQTTANLQFVPTDNPQLIAYLKRTEDNANMILTVVNLDPFQTQMGWLDLPIGDLGIPGDRAYLVQDLLPEPDGPLPTANYYWKGGRNFIKLDPRETPAHIFRVFRHVRRENGFDYWV